MKRERTTKPARMTRWTRLALLSAVVAAGCEVDDPGSSGEAPVSADRLDEAEAARGASLALKRLFNGTDHFYTTSEAEVTNAIAAGYTLEGTLGNCVASGTPLLRYVSTGSGDHFYTTDPAEDANAAASGYVYEGVACNTVTPGTAKACPVRRLFNGVDHFYTMSGTESRKATASGYALESAKAFFLAMPSSGSCPR